MSLVEMLLEAGCQINAVDGAGKTPLMHAVLMNDPELVQFLVQVGVSLLLSHLFGYSGKLTVTPRTKTGRLLCSSPDRMPTMSFWDNCWTEEQIHNGRTNTGNAWRIGTTRQLRRSLEDTG